MSLETEAELAEAVAAAEGPLAICGGGTRGGAGLSVAGLSGVRLYEPGALTLVVGAGTPMAEVEAVLAAEGQRLAFEPMDHRVMLGTSGEPTVGGMVAMGAAGPRQVQVGLVRDHVLGARFVDGLGRVVASGGRVMKNVTGLDLAKAMAGSRGALGVLSEVALRVQPVPEAFATVGVECAPDEGVRLLMAAVGTPWEVTGAAWVDGRALLRVEGFSDQVDYRVGRLVERFGGAVAEVDWAGIRDVAALAGASEVWRVSLRPSRMVGFARSGMVVDRAGAVAWVGFDPRAEVEPLGGHAVQVKGGRGRTPLGVAEQALTQGLLHKFDPKGVFAPQRWL